MNAELHPPRRARRGNQEALIVWLDEQERILRMRGVPAEHVQEFDPIHNLPEEPPEVVEGRRTLEIKFNRFGGLNLESSIAGQINRSIEERVRSRFKLEITSWIQLQNIEDGSTMDWYNTDLGGIPLVRDACGVAGMGWSAGGGKTIQHESPQHQMVIQFYQGSLCQGNLGPGTLFSSVLDVSLIGFATSVVCCPWTRTRTTSVFFVASQYIGAQPPSATCAKPVSLRIPSSPSAQI